MIGTSNIVFLFLAYLIGSVPTAVWIGKLFYGIDVREFGSGNAGATNTFRVLGKNAGIPVLIIDVLKGYLAVCLSLFTILIPNSDSFINLQIALGVSALLGHIFPVFAGFRGGKGVATILGIVLAILPLVASISIVVFLIVLFLFRYVSLASMCAGLSFPIILFIFYKPVNITHLLFAIVVAFLLIITHKKNITRLLQKKESKVNFFKKIESKN
jgi:glycerol-3-phosphate acyltransferase PlsY